MGRITSYSDAPADASVGKLSGCQMVTDGPRGTHRMDVNTLLKHIDAADPYVHKHTYRGKFLGYYVTQEQHQAIVDGTFDDLFLGDYWCIPGNSVTGSDRQYLYIADFDYYYGQGTQSFEASDADFTHPDAWINNIKRHHLVLYPTTYTAATLAAVWGTALMSYGHGALQYNYLRGDSWGDNTDMPLVKQDIIYRSEPVPIFTHRMFMNDQANESVYNAPSIFKRWSGRYLHQDTYRGDGQRQLVAGGEVMGEIDYYGHPVLGDTACVGHLRSANVFSNYKQFALFRYAPWLAVHTYASSGEHSEYLRDLMCPEEPNTNTVNWRVCQHCGGGVEVHGDAESHRFKYYIVIG